MGAFEGLQHLGLRVDGQSLECDVQMAFRCVYSTLDHLLTREDKRKVCFNAIFVEYLLCKVSRWEKMFPKKAYRTLRRMAELARKEGNPIVGDLDNPKSFPFNLWVDRKDLAAWVAEDRIRIGILA